MSREHIPERRLSSPGRQPSDIDGDVQFDRCDYCGRLRPSEKLEYSFLESGFVQAICRDQPCGEDA